MSRAVAAHETRTRHPRLQFRNISKPAFYIDHMHQNSLVYWLKMQIPGAQLKSTELEFMAEGSRVPHVNKLTR